jgi:hypothetical protein
MKLSIDDLKKLTEDYSKMEKEYKMALPTGEIIKQVEKELIKSFDEQNNKTVYYDIERTEWFDARDYPIVFHFKKCEKPRKMNRKFTF